MSTITTAEFTDLASKSKDFIHGPYGFVKNVKVGTNIASDLVKRLAQLELNKLLKDSK